MVSTSARSRSRSPRRSHSLAARRRDRSPDRSRSRERRRDRTSEQYKSSRLNDNHPPERSAGPEDNESLSKDTREKKPNYSKAFKWKSKTAESRDEDRSRDYRDRDRDRDYQPRRFGGRDDRERRVDRDRERDRDHNDRGPRNDQDRRRDGEYGNRDNRRRDDRYRDSDRTGSDKRDKPGNGRPAQPPARPAAPAAGAGVTFILVTVNDRLGTKATIPCLGSDTVGDFKKLVAAQIGRQPHEIMLKRQGQRPFKDNITLEDYEVSNGVQLDLELDTGD